jgi:hypothetical protein
MKFCASRCYWSQGQFRDKGSPRSLYDISADGQKVVMWTADSWQGENTHLAPSESRSQRVRMEGWRQGRLS